MAHIPVSLEDSVKVLILIGSVDTDSNVKNVLTSVKAGLQQWAEECSRSSALDECLAKFSDECKIFSDPESLDPHIKLTCNKGNVGVTVLINPTCVMVNNGIFELILSPCTDRLVVYGGHFIDSQPTWVFQDGIYAAEDFQYVLDDKKITTALLRTNFESKITVSCCEAAKWKVTKPNASQIRLDFIDPFQTTGGPFSLKPVMIDPGVDFLQDLFFWRTISKETESTKSSVSIGLKKFISSLEDVIKEQVTGIFSQLSPPAHKGYLRVQRPSIYIFPSGNGDSAFFKVDGFNVLINGGALARPRFWYLVRHEYRVDCVIATHLGYDSMAGLNSFFLRKVHEQKLKFPKDQDCEEFKYLSKLIVSPDLGPVFANFPRKFLENMRKGAESSEAAKASGDVSVSQHLDLKTTDLVYDTYRLLKALRIELKPLTRQSAPEPITLCYKFGVGKLVLYPISPAEDSKEIEFVRQKWGCTQKSVQLTTKSGVKQSSGEEGQSLVSDLASICCLLVWLPTPSKERIIRLLFPGNTSEVKILEGLEKLGQCDFLRTATATGEKAQVSSKASTATSKPKSSSAPKPARTTQSKQGQAQTSKAAAEVPSKAGQSSSVVKSTAAKLNVKTTAATSKTNKQATTSTSAKTVPPLLSKVTTAASKPKEAPVAAAKKPPTSTSKVTLALKSNVTVRSKREGLDLAKPAEKRPKSEKVTASKVAAKPKPGPVHAKAEARVKSKKAQEKIAKKTSDSKATVPKQKKAVGKKDESTARSPRSKVNASPEASSSKCVSAATSEKPQAMAKESPKVSVEDESKDDVPTLRPTPIGQDHEGFVETLAEMNQKSDLIGKKEDKIDDAPKTENVSTEPVVTSDYLTVSPNAQEQASAASTDDAASERLTNDKERSKVTAKTFSTTQEQENYESKLSEIVEQENTKDIKSDLDISAEIAETLHTDDKDAVETSTSDESSVKDASAEQSFITGTDDKSIKSLPHQTTPSSGDNELTTEEEPRSPANNVELEALLNDEHFASESINQDKPAISTVVDQAKDLTLEHANLQEANVQLRTSLDVEHAAYEFTHQGEAPVPTLLDHRNAPVPVSTDLASSHGSTSVDHEKNSPVFSFVEHSKAPASISLSEEDSASVFHDVEDAAVPISLDQQDLLISMNKGEDPSISFNKKPASIGFDQVDGAAVVSLNKEEGLASISLDQEKIFPISLNEEASAPTSLDQRKSPAIPLHKEASAHNSLGQGEASPVCVSQEAPAPISLDLGEGEASLSLNQDAPVSCNQGEAPIFFNQDASISLDKGEVSPIFLNEKAPAPIFLDQSEAPTRLSTNQEAAPVAILLGQEAVPAVVSLDQGGDTAPTGFDDEKVSVSKCSDLVQRDTSPTSVDREDVPASTFDPAAVPVSECVNRDNAPALVQQDTTPTSVDREDVPASTFDPEEVPVSEYMNRDNAPALVQQDTTPTSVDREDVPASTFDPEEVPVSEYMNRDNAPALVLESDHDVFARDDASKSSDTSKNMFKIEQLDAEYCVEDDDNIDNRLDNLRQDKEENFIPPDDNRMADNDQVADDRHVAEEMENIATAQEMNESNLNMMETDASSPEVTRSCEITYLKEQAYLEIQNQPAANENEMSSTPLSSGPSWSAENLNEPLGVDPVLLANVLEKRDATTFDEEGNPVPYQTYMEKELSEEEANSLADFVESELRKAYTDTNWVDNANVADEAEGDDAYKYDDNGNRTKDQWTTESQVVDLRTDVGWITVSPTSSGSCVTDSLAVPAPDKIITFLDNESDSEMTKTSPPGELGYHIGQHHKESLASQPDDVTESQVQGESVKDTEEYAFEAHKADMPAIVEEDVTSPDFTEKKLLGGPENAFEALEDQEVHLQDVAEAKASPAIPTATIELSDPTVPLAQGNLISGGDHQWQSGVSFVSNESGMSELDKDQSSGVAMAMSEFDHDLGHLHADQTKGLDPIEKTNVGITEFETDITAKCLIDEGTLKSFGSFEEKSGDLQCGKASAGHEPFSSLTDLKSYDDVYSEHDVVHDPTNTSIQPAPNSPFVADMLSQNSVSDDFCSDPIRKPDPEMAPAGTSTAKPKKQTPGVYKKGECPFYVDLAYIPHHGNKNHSSVEFFKRIRSRYYVLSGFDANEQEPNPGVLDAILQGKKLWESDESNDFNVSVIPTHNSTPLFNWYGQNYQELNAEGIHLVATGSKVKLFDEDIDACKIEL